MRFCNKISNFLNDTHNFNRISLILLNDRYLTNSIDFIKFEDFDTISYILSDKISSNQVSSNPFEQTKNRISIKIGRFPWKAFIPDIRKLISISDKEIEEFVNLFKGYFDKNDLQFRIVEGEEIKKWYSHRSYQKMEGYECGTLWKSCLRYDDRSNHLDIFINNPDKIKLLILVNSQNKLFGRALLWETRDKNNLEYRIMDRIYTIHDHNVAMFKEWARSNKYVFKLEQTSRNTILFVDDNDVVDKSLYISLDKVDFKYYPYLDTFKYFNKSKKVLSNSEYSKFEYKLIQNDGSLERTEEDADEPADWLADMAEDD